MSIFTRLKMLNFKPHADLQTCRSCSSTYWSKWCKTNTRIYFCCSNSSHAVADKKHHAQLWQFLRELKTGCDFEPYDPLIYGVKYMSPATQRKCAGPENLFISESTVFWHGNCNWASIKQSLATEPNAPIKKQTIGGEKKTCWFYEWSRLRSKIFPGTAGFIHWANIHNKYMIDTLIAYQCCTTSSYSKVLNQLSCVEFIFFSLVKSCIRFLTGVIKLCQASRSVPIVSIFGLISW